MKTEWELGVKMTGKGGVDDRKDKNEARRAGDWEMVLSTSEPTGDWSGSSGGRRQVSESVIKME